jgi:GNAT superfamily N-acetyltransferase
MSQIDGPDGYEISTDPDRLDLDRVHHWLSTDAYWALGRDRALVLRSIRHSEPFGVYRDGRQVAFARVVTDHTTFAWICDVYVDPAERGRGLGTWVVSVAREWLERLGVRRVMLATLDAHGVYAKIGFEPISTPDHLMQVRRPAS